MQDSQASITQIILNTINTLFSSLFSSIDNNIYSVLDDIIFINPGSTTYPRGGSECGFGILTLYNDISYKEIKI